MQKQFQKWVADAPAIPVMLCWHHAVPVRQVTLYAAGAEYQTDLEIGNTSGGQEARGFSLVHMGAGASLPWLCICTAVLGGGTFSDYLLKKGTSSLVARGAIAIFGLILFIIGIIGTAFTTDKIMTVFWLCITLGSLGFPVVASWAIAADKGRQYAGSVSGWMNLWGNLGGVISPVICGAIAQYINWTAALLFNIIPISFAIICWLFIKPDKPMSE